MAESSSTDPWSLPTRPGGVQLRPRRNPRLMALGVLCMCLGALGAAMAFAQLSRSESVVLVQRAVARGEVVKTGDLTVTNLGNAPGVATVPAGAIADLVGKRALVDLPMGSIVGPNAIGETVLPPGTALVGLKVAPGRIPGLPLPAGTSLILVAVPRDAETITGFQAQATVVSAPTVQADGALTLDVAVPIDSAPAVATLAATDQIVVIGTGAR